MMLDLVSSVKFADVKAAVVKKKLEPKRTVLHVFYKYKPRFHSTAFCQSVWKPGNFLRYSEKRSQKKTSLYNQHESKVLLSSSSQNFVLLVKKVSVDQFKTITQKILTLWRLWKLVLIERSYATATSFPRGLSWLNRSVITTQGTKRPWGWGWCNR